jgi:hypothetical protein
MAYADGSVNTIRPTGITYPDGREVIVNSGHTSITSPQFGQCWTLDPTGNWHGFRQDGDGNSTWGLIQARTSNPVNETTDINNTTGRSWATPSYDARNICYFRQGEHMHMPCECHMSLTGKIYLWLVLVGGGSFPVVNGLMYWVHGHPVFGVLLSLLILVFLLCVFKHGLLPYCSYVCVMPESVTFRRYYDGKEFVLKPGTTFYCKTLRADLDTEANAIMNLIYGEDRGLLINVDDKTWLFFVEGFMINGPDFRKRIEESLSRLRQCRQ